MDAALARAIESALGASIVRHAGAHGGSINTCTVASLSDGRRIFVKTRADADAETFAIEADGLEWLRRGLTSGVGSLLLVPEVMAVIQSPHALVLSAFEPGARTRESDEALGRGLAQLHASLPADASHGYVRATDLATIRLDNTPTNDWSSFYAERRLLPLLSRAEKRGIATTRMRRGMERVIARLPELVGPPERAARLHGDLWSGNASVDASGRPVIFDHAVFAGHREIDLAMMQLFGGFSSRVFAAYDEVWPRADGRERRVLLYQLLPLLAHVVLFGESYVRNVEAALAQYA
ncbi:MAG: fructosamine kinase family protein [Deltaproteobacteria bacterium]|nr:fructosamine kinase family protein [Deltaproteobacteria bacterium]